MMKLKTILFTLFMIGLITLSACSVPVETLSTTPEPKGTNPLEVFHSGDDNTGILTQDILASSDLETFEDEGAYLAFIQEYAGSNNYYGGRGGGIAVDFIAMDAVLESAPVAAAVKTTGADLDFSETNNQVTGIDEADIIKTDGDYIYTITDNTLFIVAAFPSETAEVVSTIEFEDRPQGLFVADDKLAVFGTDYEYTIKGYASLEPTLTYFEIYDISDRVNPQQEKTFSFEGNYFNARMIDDEVYFVTKNSPQYRDVHPLPIILEDDVVRSMPIDRISFFPIPYDNPQLVNAHLIDLDGKLLDSMSVAVEQPQTLYMSESDMFIVGREYINEWDIEQDILKEQANDLLLEKDISLINDINDVNPLILSSGEKENKIMKVYYTAIARLDDEEQEDFYELVEEELESTLKEIKYYEYTTITQIELDSNGFDDIEVGSVPGQIVNQFSLDQHDEYLRIATTINGRWNRFTSERTDSTTNVWTLDDDLDMVGSLTGLAPTERIFSTRFIGDKLYMVTFRQVDPFFVIDLSDPENPKDLGELKIPGFSRYLHPYDENHIIGIGQEADSRGRIEGLKISIFDVTDVSDPKEVAKFVTEEQYARSTALTEHKAFLFSREKNLLVIPAYNRDYEWRSNDGQAYNGAFVFDITAEDIELRGLIDHSKYAEDSRYYYQPAVERSLYIEDLLYTKSAGVIRINDLDDLSSVKDVELEAKDNGDIIFY